MTDADIEKRIHELAYQWCETRMLMDHFKKQMWDLVEMARKRR